MGKLSFGFHRDRIRVVSAFVIAVLVILTAASVVIPLSANNFFSDIATKWRSTNALSEKKGRYISDIYRHLGYGGFIHNFKNYVLRQDSVDRDKIVGNLTGVTTALDKLDEIYRQPGGPKLEKGRQALATLRATVENYRRSLNIADDAVQKRWPPHVTDSLVRVDDSDAILAIWSLREAWRTEEESARREFETLVSEATDRLTAMLFFVPFLVIASISVLWFVRRLTVEITQRQMAEEELQQAELLVESIAHLGEGVSVFDQNLNLVACNKNFFDLLEFPPELGIPGTSLSAFFQYNAERGEYGPGEPNDLVKERMDLALGFKPHLFERTRPDGKVIEVHGIPLPNGGIVTTYTDITNRKKAETALAEKERQLRTALDNMADGIFVLDRDMNLTLFNDRYVELIAHPNDSIKLGMPVLSILQHAAEVGNYGPGNVEDLVAARMAAYRSPERVTTEIAVNQGTRILEFRKAPLADGGAVVMITDITERRKARAEMEIKEAQLSTALESMSAGMMLIDADHKLQLFNDAASTLYQFPKHIIHEGVPLKALVNIRAERGDFGDGDPGTLARARLDSYLTTEQGRYIDTVPGGRYLDVFRAPTSDGNMVIVFHDITERVRTEERLRENEEQLTQNIVDLVQTQEFLEKQSRELTELADKYAEEKEKAQASERSKSEFLASMSHEIRTPMTGVLGLADILLDSHLPTIHHDTVLKIKSAGQSLLTIINDILDLSKLEAGKLAIENIEFNLLNVIDDAIDLIRPRAEQRGLYVAEDISRDLPHSLVGDPTRIRQVLINMVGNAVKFTHDGGITVRVRHEPDSDGGMLVRIEVEDTGIGIAADARDKLFQDFTQADSSTSRRYEGTGLGLSISKRLTELMGGHINVESELGQGSKFWLTFKTKTASGNVRRGVTDHGSYEAAATRHLSILVAEDNELNQLILKSVLEPLKHELTFAGSGVEALSAVKRKTFDVVLMDIRMPEMNGLDATRAIRQMGGDFSTLPIIAVTADVMEDHVAVYHETGMNGFATKPINRTSLLETINSVLNEEVHVFTEAEDQDQFDPAKFGNSATATNSEAESEEVSDDVTDFLNSLDALSAE